MKKIKIETCNNGNLMIVYRISFIEDGCRVGVDKLFTTRKKALAYAEEKGWTGNEDFWVYPIELVD